MLLESQTTEVAPISVSLRDAHRHSGTILSRTPLRVESSATPWDYAVSLPLTLSEAHRRVRTAPVTIAARVTVERGELGVILVGDDWTELFGPVPPALTEGSHTIFLTWEHQATHAHVVFRNTGASAPGCVFAIDAVHLGVAPPLLPPPTTSLQFVSGRANASGPVMRLILRDAFELHNLARQTGESHEFTSDPAQWGYSVSVPLDVPIEPHARVQPVIVAHIHVAEGSVGIGALDDEFQRFVTPEVDVRAASAPARIELRLDSGGSRVRLMIRNVFEGGPSRFTLRGVTLQFAERNAALLVTRTIPPVATTVYAAPDASGTFDVLVSHSSRHWVAEQCDREYLRGRWAKAGRLDDLPPFDALPPHAAPYYGLLSVFRIELSPRGVSGRLLRHYSSPEKVVHAAAVGDRIVVAFDDGAAIFARRGSGDGLDIDPDSGRRVADPWLGGVHTVVPLDDTTCLLSSSGADAILWLDVSKGSVTRRWRLPEGVYGRNYDLDATTWLNEHYVANDFQLGHLNCAAPDGRGGVFVSVLGQGDIGHVAPSGAYTRLLTGYVGCHGVRYTGARDLLYFCDSCSGRLMRVDGPDRASVLFEAGSRWLHDAVHLTAGLFLMTVADRNSLLVGDIDTGRALAEWDFGAAEGTVQFLSVAAARDASR